MSAVSDRLSRLAWAAAVEGVQYQVGDVIRRAGGLNANYVSVELRFGGAFGSGNIVGSADLTRLGIEPKVYKGGFFSDKTLGPRPD